MADAATWLSQARELHAQSHWAEACVRFDAADRAEQLEADDLERYAEAAQILGRGAEAIQLLRRAFDLCIDAGEVDRAITSAFWLFQALIINAEFARARGWAAQVRRSMPDVDNGWFLFTEAYFLIATGDYDQAAQLLARAADLGSRRRETDLIAFATTVWGRALIKAGRFEEGLSRLDEAMLPVMERDTSPRATSMMYCSAIATCHEAREFGRAREWTDALGAWLDSLPRLGGAYFGNCRIYRAYLMCLRGSWKEALEEVAFVCDDLSGNYGQLVAGHAHYQLAEIHRLLGHPEAEASYRQAAELGGPTQPGLSLLRLIQGEFDKALLGIRRGLAETPGQLERLDLLAAAVTIMLAAGDIDAARQATAELAGIAAVYSTPGRAGRARRGPRSGRTQRRGSRDSSATTAKRGPVLAGDRRPLRRCNRVGPHRPGVSGGWRRRRCRGRAHLSAVNLRPPWRPPRCASCRAALASGSGGRPFERARDRGIEAGGGRQDKPCDCDRAVRQRKNRASPRQQHLRQAGCPLPYGGSVVCHPAPPCRCRDPLTHPPSET